jgi:hypothetical protein
VDPTSTPCRPAPEVVGQAPNLTITATVDHDSGTVTIQAITTIDGVDHAVPVLAPLTLLHRQHARTTCTIRAQAAHWATQTDHTPRPAPPEGHRDYAFDTTVDARIHLYAADEEQARAEVLTGAGASMELWQDVGPLWITTASVQAIDALVEVTDQAGNPVDLP